MLLEHMAKPKKRSRLLKPKEESPEKPDEGSGMNIDKVEEAFPLNLKKFFASGKFTDFTIKTADNEFQVHKLVLCAQSEYFSRMFNGDWQESDKNETELKEDDPLAIEAMIHFMYGYRNELSGGGDISPTLLSARVYGVAEKYGVGELKQRAKAKFEHAASTCWDMDDFPHVVQEVYGSTHSTVRDLRDQVVGVARKKIHRLLEKEEFREVLEECVGFAADMVQALARKVPEYPDFD